MPMCDCEPLRFLPPPHRFARVGDNYILRSDPEEQTFRVRRVVRHHLFDPLREDGGGDGRHDIALVFLKPRRDGTTREYFFCHPGCSALSACTTPQAPFRGTRDPFRFIAPGWWGWGGGTHCRAMYGLMR